VNARVRRRRAAVLLSLALASGGLAASEVSSRVREVEARVGRPVPVVVAARELAAGRELKRGDIAVREVPERFAPPDAPGVTEEVLGAVASAPLPRGAYVTAASLGGGGGAPGAPTALRKGERAVELAVTGGAGLVDAAGPGARVDVLVSTEPREGPGRSFLALEDVEVLDLSAGAPDAPAPETEGNAPAATATATLRVTLRQAVYLTAAQNFAREVRLLPRPANDRSRAGRAAVSARGL
jgi:pilus assembly protein CpaB